MERVSRHTTIVPRLAALVAAGFAVFTFALAVPSSGELQPLAWAVMFSVLTAGLLYLSLVSGLLLSSLIIVLFTFAYSYGLGDAVSLGISRYRMPTSGDDVSSGVLLLLLFLGCMTAAAGASRALFRPLLARGHQPTAATARWEHALLYGLLLLVGFTFVFAVSTGAWSMYGAERPERLGGIQPEQLYPSSLFAAAVVLGRSLYGHYPSLNSNRMRALCLAALVVVGLLLVALQSRRFIIALIVLNGLLALQHLSRSGLKISPRRVALLAALVIPLLAGVQYVSLAWRYSSNSFTTNSVGKRLADVTDVLAAGDYVDDRDQTERLTYLWMDAAAIRYETLIPEAITLTDAFLTTVINITPGLLLPSKYQYPVVTCETAFSALDITDDLPCTPISEAYIAWGTRGVILIALLWGLFLAFAEVLVVGRGILSTVIASQCALVLMTIEASAFPMVVGFRMIALEVLALVPLALLVLLFLPGGPATRRIAAGRARRERPIGGAQREPASTTPPLEPGPTR